MLGCFSYNVVFADCGSPPSVNNSVVTVPDGTLVSATATYTCNNGYQVSGNPTIECLDTGKWANEPYCHISKHCFVKQQRGATSDILEKNLYCSFSYPFLSSFFQF